jgi:hypothetical protein
MPNKTHLFLLNHVSVSVYSSNPILTRKGRTLASAKLESRLRMGQDLVCTQLSSRVEVLATNSAPASTTEESLQPTPAPMALASTRL